MRRILYDFAVLGVPASSASRSRATWKTRVQAAALAEQLPDDPFWQDDELSVVIVYYYLNETALDVDNLAKPILDAMVGLVYRDDGQVSQLTVRKTRLEPLLEIHNPRPPLAAALEAAGDFTYVAIGTAPDHTELPE